jgi:hypothetical protein
MKGKLVLCFLNRFYDYLGISTGYLFGCRGTSSSTIPERDEISRQWSSGIRAEVDTNGLKQACQTHITSRAANVTKNAKRATQVL